MLVIAYGERYQIRDLRRFNFGTRDQAWPLRALVWQKFDYSEKGQRKLLTQMSEARQRVPPSLVLARELYTFFFLTQQQLLAYFSFSFIFISWGLITLQYFSGFCDTLTWISHGFTCVPHSESPSHLPPPVFITALFITARTWKQPRCPSADEWIRTLWYIYTMEYYSAIKKNIYF